MTDTPLTAISWEKALLGTVLSDPDGFGQVEDMRIDDFTGTHQDIWLAIMTLGQTGQVEKRAVTEQLRSQGMLDSVGLDFSEDAAGEAYLNILVSRRGDDILRYREFVEKAAIRRSLRTVGQIIQSLAQADDGDAEDLIESSIQKVLNVRRKQMTSGVKIADLLNIFTDRVDAIRDGTFRPAWKPHLEAVRMHMGYVEATEYITIAARPGEGKSSYLRFEAYHAARQGQRVAIVNLENDEIEYARAMLGLATGINTMRLKEAQVLHPWEVDQIKKTAETLSSLPLHVVTLSGPSVGRVTATLRHLIATEGLDLAMVDYVQLINNGIDNQVQDITRTTTTLRAFALENKIPIIQAAQMNRAIETRTTGAPPVLSDLRDSGSLEQDSSQVWFPRFIWNDPQPDQMAIFPENVVDGRVLAKPAVIPIRFHLAKVRNGVGGTTDAVKWNKTTGDFDTIPEGVL